MDLLPSVDLKASGRKLKSIKGGIDACPLSIFFVILASLLSGCWNEEASPEGPSPGLYACTGEDSLRIARAGPSQLQLTLNGVSLGSLERTDTTVGLEYANPTGPTVLWAKEGTVLLERFGQTRAHGCRATPDSTQKVDFGKGELRPNAWFRSPIGRNRHGYLLKYPHRLQVDQHRLHHTRFTYAGPENEPPALTDGFVLHVGLESISPDSTLRQHARAHSEHPRSGGGMRLSSFRDTTVQNRRALSWTEKTALGPMARHLAVALGPETIASVSYSTVGGRSDVYHRFVREMLSTLRFQKRPAPPSQVDIPLAMLSDPNGSPERGCDDIVFVRHQLPRTADPLATALDTLFAIKRDSVGGHRHFLAQTNQTLSLHHVSSHSSVPQVHLQGRLSGLAGVCDYPRARIQIEETARRVAAVDSVALYLNGDPTDLQPDGRGP